MADAVNHPSHYTDGKYEVIQLTSNLDFALGNAIKYISRAGKKINEKEDLEKAIWYCHSKITSMEDGYEPVTDIDDYCKEKQLSLHRANAVKNIMSATNCQDKEQAKAYLHAAATELARAINEL